MSEESVAAPALSTTQGDEIFDLGKFDDVTKDRSGYLGQVPDNRTDLVRLISKHYLVEEIVQFLNQNVEFRKITLQFPDSLVQDAALVAQLLEQSITQESVGVSVEVQATCREDRCCGSSSDSCQNREAAEERRIWILADTAYSACCVDEVASEHVNGDLVIHFGDACLNAVQKLPVLYCFGEPFFDVEDAVAQFQQRYTSHDEKVVLMANAPYTCHLKSLHDKLRALGYLNVLRSDLNESYAGPTASFVGRQKKNSALHTVFTLDNRVILSDDQTLSVSEEELQDQYDLFHITIPADPRLLFLTTKFRSLSIYDPSGKSVSQGPFPSLMRRYKFMHVARTAGTIGILVNTLSLRNTKETLRRLAKLIRDNGKKHYMFVVGKPNVAKLANFDSVDVWCILGCGQGGIIVDQYNEFYKPIVTPYELSMALNPEVTWTGQWVVDFKQVLEGLEDDPDINTAPENGDTDAPEFNAVTGQYVSTSRPLRNIAHLEISDPRDSDNKQHATQLVEKFSGAVTIGNTLSTSAMHLQNRQWSGLGSDFTPENFEEDGATVEEGGSGIASQYSFDKQNKASR
ncbi:2-(3-amino-3-carboxypropyl)histidine synthase LALA0_S03e07360g [Lachancea lanzarotensis]|uniref:2-(3-amino-3-carboxypropyl)histidine synthase subunit 2 n=1 Tax=Lachancea lanzarotensis TaxID=1245769 RepID=A0A0C7N4W3_9SACH|nr:uncharacterized protein LALA0_S03e07360g [Lachancea lanzarotensis]CEP61636.1 LALA0S03e07360g1_1 [Lachancea lanzarotensis]